MNTKIQKPSDKLWSDETGQQIPYNRITKLEKQNERSVAKILKKAESTNKCLNELKEAFIKLSEQAYTASMAAKGITNPKSKGNFTWYNFDRSIKIEVSSHAPIKFDELTIAAAKEKFHEFLESNISSKDEFVKQMIIDAFETQRTSQLDTKRILNLVRYEGKIKDAKFSEAVKLINASIRKPNTKTYYRIWIKDDQDVYHNLELNISSL
jgi:hypothetical protein